MPRWRRRSSAALLGALAALAACHGAGAPADSPEVVARARLLRIEDTRRDEPALVDSLMREGSAGLRASAALAAGRLGARSHLSGLRRLASDADVAVAADALFSLGLLQDTASAPLAIASLTRAPSVAVEGAWLLGQLGEAGRAGIVAALADEDIAPEARGALLRAAARLRPVPASAVIPLVASPDSAVAWRAAYVLARGRSAAGVRTLLAAASSPWSAVREQAARILTRQLAGDSLGAGSRAAIGRLVEDAEPRVRMNAVRALATFGPSSAPAVQRLLRDPDGNVRVSAAQSLALVLGDEAGEWRDAWNADTALSVRIAVADGASRRGLLRAEIAPWRTSDEWRRRAAAASLDSHGAAATALERVRPFLEDADGRVRASAAEALSAYADSAVARGGVRARMRELLRDPDVSVRSTALGVLAGGATAEDLAAAVDAYSRSLADADGDARLAFWTLADSAVHRSAAPPGSDVERRLATLALPASPLERAAAARIPLFAAWRDSLGGTARPLEWYQSRAREALSGVRPVLRIETERGTMELELFIGEAPLTVHNAVALARRGYFNGLRFHRVVPAFVVQAGDPRGDGNGGPGYSIRDELNRHRYLRGTLGMALSGPHTGGSQFFITHSPQPHLDGGYTVFGQLLHGGEVLDRIMQGDRIVRVTVR